MCDQKSDYYFQDALALVRLDDLYLESFQITDGKRHTLIGYTTLLCTSLEGGGDKSKLVSYCSKSVQDIINACINIACRSGQKSLFLK